MLKAGLELIPGHPVIPLHQRQSGAQALADMHTADSHAISITDQ